MPLRAGVSRVAVTPSLGLPPGAWRLRTGPAVRAPMLAQALVRDDGKCWVAIVATHLLGITRDRAQETRTRVREPTGIGSEAVLRDHQQPRGTRGGRSAGTSGGQGARPSPRAHAPGSLESRGLSVVPAIVRAGGAAGQGRIQLRYRVPPAVRSLLSFRWRWSPSRMNSTAAAIRAGSPRASSASSARRRPGARPAWAM